VKRRDHTLQCVAWADFVAAIYWQVIKHSMRSTSLKTERPQNAQTPHKAWNCSSCITYSLKLWLRVRKNKYTTKTDSTSVLCLIKIHNFQSALWIFCHNGIMRLQMKQWPTREHGITMMKHELAYSSKTVYTVTNTTWFCNYTITVSVHCPVFLLKTGLTCAQFMLCCYYIVMCWCWSALLAGPSLQHIVL
jgi:hypothetical protein